MIDGCVGIFITTDRVQFEWCTAHKKPHRVCELEAQLRETRAIRQAELRVVEAAEKASENHTSGVEHHGCMHSIRLSLADLHAARAAGGGK